MKTQLEMLLEKLIIKADSMRFYQRLFLSETTRFNQQQYLRLANENENNFDALIQSAKNYLNLKAQS